MTCVHDVFFCHVCLCVCVCVCVHAAVGALDLTNKIAYSVMTPLDKVVMLSTEQRIDKDTIHMLLSSGHSRIPVYAGNDR